MPALPYGWRDGEAGRRAEGWQGDTASVRHHPPLAVDAGDMRQDMRELRGRDMAGRRHPAPRTPEWQPAGLCERQAGMRRGERGERDTGWTAERGKTEGEKERRGYGEREGAGGDKCLFLFSLPCRPPPPACRELYEDVREL